MFNVHLVRELAHVNGDKINLYRAVVDYRPSDNDLWERYDASILFDTIRGANTAKEELVGLYITDPPKSFQGIPD